jgi:hypothetical protein
LFNKVGATAFGLASVGLTSGAEVRVLSRDAAAVPTPEVAGSGTERLSETTKRNDTLLPVMV